jgi:hypothetical protein
MSMLPELNLRRWMKKMFLIIAKENTIANVLFGSRNFEFDDYMGG